MNKPKSKDIVKSELLAFRIRKVELEQLEKKRKELNIKNMSLYLKMLVEKEINPNIYNIN